MSTAQHDFRDQAPVWVKYLTYVGGGSDKFYECRIDLADNGTYVLTKRWGRRPDRGGGQIKVSEHSSLSYARGLADGQIQTKMRGGYFESVRPESADAKVAKDDDIDDDEEDY